MAEFTSYEPGTPCWVDLGSPDLDVSKSFYGSLFGWEAQTAPDPAAGGYTMFTLRGKQVAGLGPLMSEGQPPAWSTYISVDDADKTAEAAVEAGGQVIVAPMDVLTAGRMAIFLDPAGAAISVWQPRDHFGAELGNEPGSFCWNELNTRDVAASRAFHSAVFGWTITEVGPDAGPMEYYEIKRGETPVAGMMPMVAMVPAEVPSHWLTYFAVEDADAAAAKVQQLGGGVLAEPMDIPVGRFAVVTGPHREAFGIIKVTR